MPAQAAAPDLVPILSEIARVAGETLELPEVFHRIATAAGRALAFDAMTVTLTDEGDGFVLYTIGGAGVTDETRRSYARMVPRSEYSAGLWQVLTKAGVIDDVTTACDAAFPRDRELRDSGVRAMLRTPLHAGARTMGYLSLLGLKPRAFRCEDLTLLTPIADIVAMAVAHARLGAAEKERRRRYESLQALFPVLARALDVREVFDAISEIVRPVVPHDRMALGLLNEARDAVRVYAVSGTGIPEIRGPILLPVSGHEPARPAVAAPGEGRLLPPGGVNLETLEKGYVKEALEKARFNKSKAAKLLGLTRVQLYSRIEKYQLGEGKDSS